MLSLGVGRNIATNVYVYELWRVSAQTFPDKNRLWKIRRIFQVRTDQAIAYIRLLCVVFYFSSLLISLIISPFSFQSVQIPISLQFFPYSFSDLGCPFS